MDSMNYGFINDNRVVRNMSKSYEAFMRLDTSKYLGEFVGMCDGVLVAHSKSFDEVYEATKKACGTKCTPFISQVLPAECMLL